LDAVRLDHNVCKKQRAKAKPKNTKTYM